MDDNVQKSCWGIATWSVLILGGILVLAFALGDVGTAAIAVK